MKYKNFDEYWAANWTKLSSQPEVMDAAFREVAEKAWYAAVEECRAVTHSLIDASLG